MIYSLAHHDDITLSTMISTNNKSSYNNYDYNTYIISSSSDINMIILLLLLTQTYYSILPEYQNLVKKGNHFPYNMIVIC